MQFVRTMTWARSERGSCFASCLSCFSDGVAATSECRKQNCVTGVCSMKPLLPHQRCHNKLTARVCRIQWNRERRWRFRRFRWGSLAGPTMFDGSNHCSRDGRHSARDAVSKTPRSCPEYHTRIMEWQPEAPVIIRPGRVHFRAPQMLTRRNDVVRCSVQLCTGISPCRDIHRFDVSSSTTLNKPDGGVRGIATGCSLRRLVARTLAKQFGSAFEAECAPFQCTLFNPGRYRLRGTYVACCN